MRKLFIILLIIPFMTSPADASVFQSGFETGDSPPASYFRTVFAPGSNLDGWTVSAGSIDWIDDYWQPAEGRRSVDLAGNGAGVISTAFSTTPGQQYTVSFFLSGNYDGNQGDLVRTTLASIDGGTPLSFDFNYFTGWSHGNMGWVSKSFTFTASGATTTLAFSSGEDIGSPYGPALDKVEVAPVPAPPSIILLVTGLIGLVSVRRRIGK
jgi:choice-of-anchor C domain-containing protein